MHNSEQPEFIKTIGEIKGAEEEYDRLILEAKQKADKILRDAKERIADENNKNADEIVEFKNERLRDGSKEIESKVEGLVKKAQDGGSTESKKKLGAPAISKLVKDFLNNL